MQWPTTPTLSDYVSVDDSAGTGAYDTYEMSDLNMSATTIYVWVYGSTAANASIRVNLYIAGAWQGVQQVLGPGIAGAWGVATFTGAWSSGQVNDRQVKISKGATGANTAATVYALYDDAE